MSHLAIDHTVLVTRLASVLDETYCTLDHLQSVIPSKMNIERMTENEFEKVQSLDKAAQEVAAVSTILKNLSSLTAKKYDFKLIVNDLLKDISLSSVEQKVKGKAYHLCEDDHEDDILF